MSSFHLTLLPLLWLSTNVRNGPATSGNVIKKYDFYVHCNFSTWDRYYNPPNPAKKLQIVAYSEKIFSYYLVNDWLIMENIRRYTKVSLLKVD